MLAVAEPFLAQNIHPTVIIREYRQALEDAVKLLQEKISTPIDLNDREKVKEVVSIIYCFSLVNVLVFTNSKFITIYKNCN